LSGETTATPPAFAHGRGAASGLRHFDQGAADQFLERELQPQRFVAAAGVAGQQVTLRMQEGYDHSYYFVSTFIDDHLRWHARGLSG